MDVRFVASFAVITADPDAEHALFADRGISLRPADTPDTDYTYTEDLDGHRGSRRRQALRGVAAG